MDRRWITLSMTILVALGLYWGSDLETPLRIGLSILTLIALLWVTETFNITITALLIPVLTVSSGVFSVDQALSNFAHPIIFLFLGGFALAAALHRQQLDIRLASLVMRAAKGRLSVAALLLFITTAFVSMWISNTATTAMMLPLALGLLVCLPYENYRPTYWYLLLGIAYSANIGGIGTLVGSPPNAIAAAAAGISFAEWSSFGVPIVLVLLPLMFLLLRLVFRPDLSHRIEQEIPESSNNHFTKPQYLTLGVFLLTVLLWLLSQPISKVLGISKDFDSLVAIMAIVLIAALRLVEWKDIENSANWGVLLLFGGGLTLSALLKETGTSVFLAEGAASLLQGAPLLLLLFVIVFFMVMLTEVASNTASSALMIPIFASIAEAMGISSAVMAVVIAIAASSAFMLPVATPPNAIVFGSGYIPQSQMIRIGLVLNLVLACLISLVTWFII
ncbi:MAG: DASS family sodium-coupled anion symporter [Sedimenticola selenatireducens]|uniref:DASS family sodium-coupled anion symporter n=2 Tax=Sedimenticola selenatireducens TaxID=191960 RepID=A0A557S228_9GAMM|nr:DASS family sodium-coupled anion symporter [Sedimenticola selenatireducens]TVT66170.1 MAG: DASS family sodium-coupled anion symporter [Sedimenticola selenatireducens]